jgi:hypothetical protein
MDGGASAYAIYAAATAVAAASAIASAQAASADSKAQAEQARLNAEAVRQQNAMREDFVRQQSGAALGEQRASAAQSGFDPSSGSLLKLQSDSAKAAELDALSARYEGELMAVSLENEANMLGWRSKKTKQQGYVNASAILLDGAAKGYGRGNSVNKPHQETGIRYGTPHVG